MAKELIVNDVSGSHPLNHLSSWSLKYRFLGPYIVSISSSCRRCMSVAELLFWSTEIAGWSMVEAEWSAYLVLRQFLNAGQQLDKKAKIYVLCQFLELTFSVISLISAFVVLLSGLQWVAQILVCFSGLISIEPSYVRDKLLVHIVLTGYPTFAWNETGARMDLKFRLN